MVSLKIKYVDKICAKGRTYYYFRYCNKRRKMPDDPQTKEFMERYNELLKTIDDFDSTPDPNSVAGVIVAYKQSSGWRELAEKTRKSYRDYLDRIAKLLGDVPIKNITRRVVLKMQDSLAARPASANYQMAVFKMLLSYAVHRGLIATNPAAAIKRMKVGTHSPWSREQIARMCETTNVGFKTALYLALYTGQRQSDMLAMTWENIKDNKIVVRQQKTGKQLEIPLHKELNAYLSALKSATGALIRRQDGEPYKPDHFRHDWIDEARSLGITGVVFHGLRKNATINLIEAGCTEREVASITGMSPQMISHYAQKVNQSLLADSAMKKLESAKLLSTGLPNFAESNIAKWQKS